MSEERLLLNSRNAAKMLSISERTLWQHSEPRGEIPVIRLGSSVRYSVAALERFVDRSEKSPAAEVA